MRTFLAVTEKENEIEYFVFNENILFNEEFPVKNESEFSYVISPNCHLIRIPNEVLRNIRVGDLSIMDNIWITRLRDEEGNS